MHTDSHYLHSALLLSIQRQPNLCGKDGLVNQGYLVVGEAEDAMVDILYK